MRLGAAVFVAAVLAGCVERVPLLTGTSPMLPNGGCFTNFAAGLLIVDPTYGTAILDKIAGGYEERDFVRVFIACDFVDPL